MEAISIHHQEANLLIRAQSFPIITVSKGRTNTGVNIKEDVRVMEEVKKLEEEENPWWERVE